MNLIAAVDANWAIGYKNKLLVSIPDDMKFFRQTTTGKVVVMGRKTLESFPNGQPLKNRVNIVLTSDKNYKVKDAIVVHDLDELHKELEQYNSEDVYVITKIDYAYDADAYFPNLDEKEEWQITEDSDEQTYFDLEYYFLKYERIR